MVTETRWRRLSRSQGSRVKVRAKAVRNARGRGGRRGVSNNPLNFDPNTLFASGEDGFYREITGITGLFQATGPSLPITASGQTVAYVTDDSGNANHLTQGAGGAEPAYIESGGKFWLDFDGIDDQFISANGAFDFGTLSVHFALKQDSIAAGQMLYSRSVTTNNTVKEALLYIENTGIVFTHINGTSTGALAVHHPHDTVTPFCMGFQFASAGLYVNGAFAETVGTGATITYPTPNLPTFFLGQDRASVKYNGRVYAMLAINRSLTNTEIAGLHAYWAAKLF